MVKGCHKYVLGAKSIPNMPIYGVLMRLFNSLSRKVEEFRPISPDKVIMYICGLTPYDAAHIGHARAYVSFDILKRYLMRKGHTVYHIQNITDVEDKIIKRCKETGADPVKLTTQNHDEALELFGKLDIMRADVYPKVTEHIPEIIALIRTLVGAGKAYETKSGVYFDISSYPAYGALSGQNLEEIQAGSRYDVDETKKDAGDFALWKKTSGEIIEFESPWGRGRPGWHIECSAMAKRYAGRTLDIHGGARDLIFPHHENEIAQSQAASDEKFSNLWIHAGFLTVDGEKMSKSLGNFVTLKEALSKNTPNALRLFYIKAHYRSPLDYKADDIDSCEESVERIFNSLGLVREALGNNKVSAGTGAQKMQKNPPAQADHAFRKESDALIASFYFQMDEDLNTSEAIASLFGLLRLSNTHIGEGKHDLEQLDKVRLALEDMLSILGLVEKRSALDGKLEPLQKLLGELGSSGAVDDPEKAISLIISMRDEARKKKDFARSDMIRARLKEIGVILEDKAGSGIRWKIE